jgi:CheY-like chemotaxis protein
VTITDNGMGMSDALVATVFDLFVQGERTLDRAQGGLGIGLSIVKRLVDMHGGTVTATSGGPGRGSSFEIRLPLADDTHPATELPAPAQLRPRRILVVDDNEDGATMLAALLEFDGHQVTTSLSGLEAVDIAIAARPDVVLLDIGLPGLDGYEVARRIRAAADGAVRLVAITGYGRDEDRARARDAGFAAHLVKPVNFDALRRVLADIS